MIKEPAINQPVKVIKNNYPRGKGQIGATGVIAKYNDDAKLSILVRSGDTDRGWAIWFDADELERL